MNLPSAEEFRTWALFGFAVIGAVGGWMKIRKPVGIFLHKIWLRMIGLREISSQLTKMNVDGELFRNQIKNQLNSIQTEINDKLDKFEGQIGEIKTQTIQMSARQRANINGDPRFGRFETNEKGQFLFVNRKLCRIANRQTEEMLGNGWTNCIKSDERQEFMLEWLDCIQEKREISKEITVVTPEGLETKVLFQTFKVLEDGVNNLGGYSGVVTPI